MLLFFDGFDHYFAPQTAKKKWDDGGRYFTTAPGRFGGRYGQILGSGTSLRAAYKGITKTVDPAGIEEIIFGGAFRIMGISYTGVPLMAIIGNDDERSHQIQFHLDGITGELKIGSANAGYPPGLEDVDPADFPPDYYTPTDFIPPFGLWFFLEAKITADGDVIVMVDGEEILNVTGVLTLVNGATAYTAVQLMAQTPFSSDFHVDDFYICDTTGAKNNDFLGELRVEYREPTADGFVTDFNPSPNTGPTNFQNVDGLAEWVEQSDPPDNYLQYNSSSTLNAQDLFDIADFDRDGTIFGVQVNLACRKDDVGNRKVAAILRSGGTIYVGDMAKLFSDYVYIGDIWENNPNGNIDWTLSAVNATQAGIKIVE